MTLMHTVIIPVMRKVGIVVQVHARELTVLLDGQAKRICQQCSSFHPVAAFDGSKRWASAELASLMISARGDPVVHAGVPSSILAGLQLPHGHLELWQQSCRLSEFVSRAQLLSCARLCPTQRFFPPVCRSCRERLEVHKIRQRELNSRRMAQATAFQVLCPSPCHMTGGYCDLPSVNVDVRCGSL